jgi:hypothetical protein
MKEKNARSLDAIADDINQLKRANIFDIGDLLVEAKAQCEHGQWYDWLEAEFEWSEDSAGRYMNVARLGAKYRTLRDLNLAATTLYRLAAYENEDELPAIIEELTTHATTTRLKPDDAARVMQVGIGRHRFGDRPDATLLRLLDLDECSDEAWHEKAVITLQERNPETIEDADALVDKIELEYLDAERIKGAEEARERSDEDDILDGPLPVLPPPTTPPEPQRLGATTAWPETDLFASAVKDLLELRAKPLQRFSGVFSSAELREVSAFLTSVAAVDERKAA